MLEPSSPVCIKEELKILPLDNTKVSMLKLQQKRKEKMGQKEKQVIFSNIIIFDL